MTIDTIKLPTSERFACSLKAAKQLFAEFENLSVHFGSLGKTFAFDSRAKECPTLSGPVVASLSISRDSKAILRFYAVRRNAYSHTAADEFVTTWLPVMQEWLLSKLSRPATAILGIEQLLIEWNSQKHRKQEIRFL